MDVTEIAHTVLPPSDLAGKSIVISGSREWRYPNMVAILIRVLASAPVKEVLVGFDPRKRTPRGVDLLVWDACVSLGVPVRSFPVEWMEKGKINFQAGHKRNIKMIDEGDFLIGCWETQAKRGEPSTGTAQAIVYAHQVGKLYRIYSPPDREQDPEKLLRLAYSVRRLPYPERPAETPSLSSE